MKDTITCEKELGRWTIRVNGWFVIDFGWFGAERKARAVAMKLHRGLYNVEIR